MEDRLGDCVLVLRGRPGAQWLYTPGVESCVIGSRSKKQQRILE
jgi:hypothetical protein